MISVDQICPPAQFKPEGIGEPVIGVRLLVPPGALNPSTLPEHNRTGTEILCRLLQARMELAGVRVSRALGGFPLNRSFYVFTVSELAAAQEAVREELEKLSLLEYAQIAWRDPREEVWRVWYSKAGQFESTSDEELAAERELLTATITWAEQLQKAKDEPGS